MIHHVGDNYQSGLDIKDIAKLVRADIKRLHPKVKASVRIERFSMGQSLNITVKGCDFNPLNPAYVNWDLRSSQAVPSNLTPAGRALLESLRNIAESYNQKEVDGLSDYYNVNFHCMVDYDYDFRADCKDALSRGIIN